MGWLKKIGRKIDRGIRKVFGDNGWLKAAATAVGLYFAAPYIGQFFKGIGGTAPPVSQTKTLGTAVEGIEAGATMAEKLKRVKELETTLFDKTMTALQSQKPTVYNNITDAVSNTFDKMKLFPTKTVDTVTGDIVKSKRESFLPRFFKDTVPEVVEAGKIITPEQKVRFARLLPEGTGEFAGDLGKGVIGGYALSELQGEPPQIGSLKGVQARPAETSPQGNWLSDITPSYMAATNSLVPPVSIPEVASQNLYGNGAPHFIAQTVPAPFQTPWGLTGTSTVG